MPARSRVGGLCDECRILTLERFGDAPAPALRHGSRHGVGEDVFLALLYPVEDRARDGLRGALRNIRKSTRFSQFEKSLGLAPNILAKRLESFVADGLMRRRQPRRSGEQPEYVLTQRGLDLKPVIIALTEWGDKWVQPGPVVYQTASDGKRVEIQLRKVGDDKQVAVTDVIARLR